MSIIKLLFICASVVCGQGQIFYEPNINRVQLNQERFSTSFQNYNSLPSLRELREQSSEDLRRSQQQLYQADLAGHEQLRRQAQNFEQIRQEERRRALEAIILPYPYEDKEGKKEK